MKKDKHVAATKSVEQPDRQSLEGEKEGELEDEGYEIVDADAEDASEQPGAEVVLNESDTREELAIPSINEEPGPFWHVTVPPGKRHLIQVLVGTPRVTLSWKFSTEKRVKTCNRIRIIRI